jgi:hypothetical protein
MRHQPISRQKHHYIPVFYLKNWAINDGRLIEFSRPYKKIRALTKNPSATGYEYNLYALGDLPAENVHALEQHFMKKVDQLACNVVRVLLRDHGATFNIDEKSAWSRFILSLIQRNPTRLRMIYENVDRYHDLNMADFERNYEALRRPTDPLTFVEYQQRMAPHAKSILKATAFQELIDLRNVGGFINSMRWHVVEIINASYNLLTSDQPVVMSNGLQYDNAYILLPLSPSVLFVATNSTETEKRIARSIKSDRCVQQINNIVSSQAERYVYDINEDQIRFIDHRLGKSNRVGTFAHRGRMSF